MLTGHQLTNTLKKYCSGSISEIEGYDEAINSPERYVCHHRMEIQPDGVRLSKEWMIEHGIYYGVDPCMLVFMKESDHISMHHTGRRNKWTSEARVNASKARRTENGFSARFREHFGYGREVDNTLFNREKCFFQHHGACSWENPVIVDKRYGSKIERGDSISTAKLKEFGKEFFEHTGLLPKDNKDLYNKLRYLNRKNRVIRWEDYV